jgi:transaldolase
MPEATLRAFADHGQASHTLDESTAAAEDILRNAQAAGIDLAAITAQLERDGVQSFCASYEELIDRITTKTEATALTRDGFGLDPTHQGDHHGHHDTSATFQGRPTPERWSCR